eukprot:COSAG04_NODE_307_length_17238_cov_17.860260_9_plen_119_part_00
MLAPWVTAAQAVRGPSGLAVFMQPSVPEALCSSCHKIMSVSALSALASLVCSARKLTGKVSCLLYSQTACAHPLTCLAQASLSVFAWTVNDEATIARMVSIGVDAIVTDYPERIPHAH